MSLANVTVLCFLVFLSCLRALVVFCFAALTTKTLRKEFVDDTPLPRHWQYWWESCRFLKILCKPRPTRMSLLSTPMTLGMEIWVATAIHSSARRISIAWRRRRPADKLAARRQCTPSRTALNTSISFVAA